MEQHIKQQIVDFITTNFLFADIQTGIGETDSLLETGVIDSTGVLEIVAFIEERYGIKVEDEEILPENMDSIAGIFAYVSRKVSLGSPVGPQSNVA